MTAADWEEVRRLSEMARKCASEHKGMKYVFCENFGCMSLMPLIQAVEWTNHQSAMLRNRLLNGRDHLKMTESNDAALLTWCKREFDEFLRLLGEMP